MASPPLRRSLKRGLSAVVVFLYFNWKTLVTLVLPTAMACAVAPALLYDLPLQESIPACSVLWWLALLAWWHWYGTKLLRRHVADLEMQLEEVTEYQ